MPATLESLKEIFSRDLQKLESEIALYDDEALLWKTAGEIQNSAGNLCLHLCGNLQHFIGAVLGGNGYVRNRDAEFSMKNIPKDQLLREISVTRLAVSRGLDGLSEADLLKDYPLPVLGKTDTTVFFLVHLAAHLNYHLGQINYHRRLVK